MKTFQAVFNELEVDGVFSISLVHDPAMKGIFVALKEQTEIKLAEIDKEQRILMGLVLEPNKPVYRKQNNEEFQIIFNEDTIKDLSYHFFKSNSHKNSSIEHTKDKIEGVTFVESWIVEDSEKDKSANFGFSHPKGSWVATMKVDNDEIWNDYVKTGKVKGFSIDAMLSLKEINLKSDIKMSTESKNSFVDDILIALKLKTVEPIIEVKLGSLKGADGVTVFEYEGDTPEVGGAVWVMAEDGTKVPVPVGEIPLEDASILVVEQEGIIAAVKPTEVVDENLESTAPADANSVMNQVQESIKSIMIKYQENLDARFDKLEKSNIELNAKVVELSEQPAAYPIVPKTNPVKLGDMTALEKRRYFKSINNG